MLAVSTGALRKDVPLEPIFVEQPRSVKTKRLSAGQNLFFFFLNQKSS